MDSVDILYVLGVTVCAIVCVLIGILVPMSGWRTCSTVEDYHELLDIPKREDVGFIKIPKKTEEKPKETCKPCDANMVTFDYDMNEWNGYW